MRRAHTMLRPKSYMAQMPILIFPAIPERLEKIFPQSSGRMPGLHGNA